MSVTFTNHEVAADYLRRLYKERPEIRVPQNRWYHPGKLLEEAGEAWREWMRLSGLHRRDGDPDKYAEELADVVISAYACAIASGMDLDAAIQLKHTKLMSREMRESAP